MTDFTYVATWTGFVYVAFAIDLFSRAIVGWQVSTAKDTSFVEACLRMALWRRDHTRHPIVPGMIHHSDAANTPPCVSPKRWPSKDSPPRSEPLATPMTTAAETVMGLFKNEAIAKNSPFRTGPLKSMPDVEEVTFDWVSWYNNERLHSFLGNIPPEEYERNYYAQNIGASTGDAANKTAA